MMYKYAHGMLPQMIQDFYVTNNAVHHYSTRQSNLLHVTLGVHTNNFLYKSNLIWNKLSTLGISFCCVWTIILLYTCITTLCV